MTENNSDLNEFKVYGITIEKFSIIYGLFLIFFGLLVSLISNSESMTSYIPSFLGLPILIFSFVAIKFKNKKKLFMHIVVIFGLLIFFGGLDLIRSLINGNVFQNFWPDFSKFIMLISSIFFNIQCIKSFLHARNNKT
tara:strand:- start:132 stop:545 length:414 start_codon:yes stop_codon:yes gene_type:complete